MNELFDAILAVKSKEEAVNFFRDLLTLPELSEFSSRWQMVKRLVRGEPYLKIAKDLGVSTTTVARVAHWLHEGRGGYKALAERLFDARKNPDYHPTPGFSSGKLRGWNKPNEL